MSCISSPTLTRTDQVVTNSLSTSTTSHLTTFPPSTTTITLTPSCTASSGQCTPSAIVTVSEIPGGTSTVVDTVTVTVPITSSQITTLWGSSCSRTDPNTPTSTSTDTSTTEAASPSFSTPPPSIFITSSSSTRADGSVTPVILTITSAVPPVLVSPTASSADGIAQTNSDSSKILGPIIGGVVGGVVGLCVLLFLVWFFMRRRQRWDDIFDNDHDVPAVAAAAAKKEKAADAKPKPYHYGLVGHTKSPSLTSPSSSPPPSAAPTLLDNTHYRSNSMTPLLHLPMNATVHGTGTSPSFRPPSSSSSALDYGSQVDTNAQAQMWGASRLYNAPVQSQASFSGPSAGPVGPIAAMIGRMDSDHRAGSPISFQEQRILQVTNADVNPQNRQILRVGSSSLAGVPSSDPQSNGKGRFITKGETAPIVHLDGGRYQEPVAESSSATAPAPPAYSA